LALAHVTCEHQPDSAGCQLCAWPFIVTGRGASQSGAGAGL